MRSDSWRKSRIEDTKKSPSRFTPGWGFSHSHSIPMLTFLRRWEDAFCRLHQAVWCRMFVNYWNKLCMCFFAEKAKFLHNLLIIFILDAICRTNLHQIGARRECGRRSTLGRGESVYVKTLLFPRKSIPSLGAMPPFPSGMSAQAPITVLDLPVIRQTDKEHACRTTHSS